MPCDSAAAEGRAIRSEVVEGMLCGAQASEAATERSEGDGERATRSVDVCSIAATSVSELVFHRSNE